MPATFLQTYLDVGNVMGSNVGKKHQKARTKHEKAPGIMVGEGAVVFFSITLRYDGYSGVKKVKTTYKPQESTEKH